MPESIPKPPPLPPSVAKFIKAKIIDHNNNRFLSNRVDFKVCLWALNDSEIQRACFFARTCLELSPRECIYMIVNPILQSGMLKKLQISSMNLKVFF